MPNFGETSPNDLKEYSETGADKIIDSIFEKQEVVRILQQIADEFYRGHEKDALVFAKKTKDSANLAEYEWNSPIGALDEEGKVIPDSVDGLEYIRECLEKLKSGKGKIAAWDTINRNTSKLLEPGMLIRKLAVYIKKEKT